MEKKIKILKKEEYKSWERLLKEVKINGACFSSDSWLNPLSKIFNSKIQIAGCFENRKLIGGINLFITKRWGLKMISVPPVTPYNSLILKEKNYTGVLSEISNFLQKRYDVIKINLSPALKGIRSFQWLGFNCQPRYTYLHNLTKHQEQTLPRDSSLRNKIRKAKRNQIKIKAKNDFSLFWSLYEKTFKRQKFLPPFSKNDFLYLTREYEKSGLIKMFVARNKRKKAIAARIEVEDKPFVCDWIAGADPELLGSGGNQLLMWEILNYYSKNGYQTFDFCGADIPSVAKYKASFGGKLIQYFNIEKYCSWKAKIYKANKDYFSNLFRLWK
jgi:hypothetical protein